MKNVHVVFAVVNGLGAAWAICTFNWLAILGWLGACAWLVSDVAGRSKKQ